MTEIPHFLKGYEFILSRNGRQRVWRADPRPHVNWGEIPRASERATRPHHFRYRSAKHIARRALPAIQCQVVLSPDRLHVAMGGTYSKVAGLNSVAKRRVSVRAGNLTAIPRSPSPWTSTSRYTSVALHAVQPAVTRCAVSSAVSAALHSATVMKGKECRRKRVA